MMLVRGLLALLRLRLLRLLLLHLLLLLALLVLLRVRLRALLHLLRRGRVLNHLHNLVLHVRVLLAADLLDVLLAVFERQLVLHTLEGGNRQDVGKIDDCGNILGKVLGALLLLSQNLRVRLHILDDGRNVLNESHLLLQHHHIGRLGSELFLVALLVGEERLLLGEVQLLLNPSILLRMKIRIRSQTSFS